MQNEIRKEFKKRISERFQRIDFNAGCALHENVYEATITIRNERAVIP